jgi:hypothetical protein
MSRRPEIDSRKEVASALMASAGQTISREDALAFVDAALKPGKQRNMTAAYLMQHSDGLTSGDSSAPPGVAELVRVLRAAGHRRFALPRCLRCSAERKLPYVVESGRVCTACFLRVNAEPCSTCGRVKPVSVRSHQGPICGECWRKSPERMETCSSCGEPGPVARRRAGGAICPKCYASPPAECAGCGQIGPIHSRRSGLALCRACYVQPERPCARCGTIGRVVRRAAPGNDGDLCEACYEAPVVECVGCGRIRRCNQRSEEGPLCQGCSVRPVHQCVRCGRSRPAQKMTDDGAICSGCYDHIHRVACARCGESCRPYADGLCVRCVASDRLRSLAGQSWGEGPLVPMWQHLAAAPDPRSIISWLSRPGPEALLQRIGGGTLELSHAALDLEERTKPLDHLRDLLVATGVLPARDPRFERLGPWLDATLADVPAAHALVIRPFATWGVFRRLRKKAERGQLTESAAKWARMRVRVALTFLDWLDDHGVELEGVTQADMDLWLASGSTTRYVVRDFVAWCRARRVISGVKVPLRQTMSAVEPVHDDDRWSNVDDLLHDETVDLDVRVAGLFALLFGQHLSRVVRLKVTDLVVSDGAVALKFGVDAVVLPPVLDGLVLRLRERRGHSITRSEQWLFPGGAPGRHITAERLRERLAEQGITLRSTRSAALMALAAELPAPVLADLLGLHVNTSVEWVRAARGDWSAYAATKASAATDTR